MIDSRFSISLIRSNFAPWTLENKKKNMLFYE